MAKRFRTKQTQVRNIPVKRLQRAYRRAGTPEVSEQLSKIYERGEKRYSKYRAEQLLESPIQRTERRLRGELDRPARTIGRITRDFQGTAKATRRRVRAARTVLGAFGVIEEGSRSSGPGRPRGTFKYGLPIQEYKRLMAQKRAMFREYQEQQRLKLRQKGFNPEQVQQLQQEEYLQGQTQPQQTQQFVEQPIIQRQTFAKPKPLSQAPHVPVSVADEELEFHKFVSAQTSPNTQQMLDNLRRTQLKGVRDDIDMQRRLREKAMLAQAGNILDTPFIFKKNQVDFTGVPEDNILMAPNLFLERQEDNILRPRGTSVLDTKSSGFRLKFF